MNYDLQTLTSVALVASVVYVVGAIGVYVWYALALSKVFPKLGGEGWKAWVPILNEAEIFARGGVPAWSVVYLFIPIVQFYGLYLKVTALSRINAQFGRGVGMTVLGLLVPPVWASVLAWGKSPVAAGYDERVAAMMPTPGAATGPLAAPAPVPAEPAFPTFASEPPVAPATPAFVAEVPVVAPTATAPVEPAAPAFIENPWAPRQPDAAPTPTVAVPAAIVPPVAVPPVQPLPSAPAVSVPPLIEPPLGVGTVPEPVVPLPAPVDFPVLPTQPDPVVEVPAPAEVPAPVPEPAPTPSPEPVAVPEPSPEPVVPEPSPEPAPAAAFPPADESKTVFTRPTRPSDDEDEEDEFAATVVVDRRPQVSWSLLLDDGRTFPLTASHVALGRKPDGIDADVQLLSIPDQTRTLSKTHARLELVDGQWSVTDLNSTNGVIVIGAGDVETLLTPGGTAQVADRFILGKVGMRVAFEEGTQS